MDVITPPASHAPICAEAATRGIPIECQKPLAPSFEEARGIVDHAGAAGVRCMVHENFRFQPWHREIKRQIQAGALGDRLHSLHFRMRMGEGWGANAYIPRQPYFRDYPRLLIYETGVHFIDTFRHLAGEIIRVTAGLRRLSPVIQGEDRGVVVSEFADGVIGVYDANRCNETPAANPRYTCGDFLVEGSADGVRLRPDGPSGTGCASGFSHSQCFIVPEWEMVLVRMGTDGSVPDEVHNAFLRRLGQAVSPLAGAAPIQSAERPAVGRP